jgi:hypothetical protein
MVAYSFQRQFIEPIRAGSKRQTIRADRKRHARHGETLQLYTGMRTKHCRLIGTAICRAVNPVTIDFDWNTIAAGPVNLKKLHELEAFARSDGFASWSDMRKFWRDTHGEVARWSGILIEWRDFTAAEAAP